MFLFIIIFHKIYPPARYVTFLPARLPKLNWIPNCWSTATDPRQLCMHSRHLLRSVHNTKRSVGRSFGEREVEARNKQHRLNKSAPKLSVYESRLGKVQLVFQLPIFAIYPPNTRAILRISTGKNPKTRLSFATHPHIDTTGKEQLSLSSVVTVGFTLQHASLLPPPVCSTYTPHRIRWCLCIACCCCCRAQVNLSGHPWLIWNHQSFSRSYLHRLVFGRFFFFLAIYFRFRNRSL